MRLHPRPLPFNGRATRLLRMAADGVIEYRSRSRSSQKSLACSGRGFGCDGYRLRAERRRILSIKPSIVLQAPSRSESEARANPLLDEPMACSITLFNNARFGSDSGDRVHRSALVRRLTRICRMPVDVDHARTWSATG